MKKKFFLYIILFYFSHFKIILNSTKFYIKSSDDHRFESNV